MRGISKYPTTFKAAVLILCTLVSPSSAQTPAEDAVLPISDNATKKALTNAVDRYSTQLSRYLRIVNDIKKSLDKGSKPLLTGLKILTGEPVVIDQSLIDNIAKQKEQLNTLAKGLKTPALNNPVSGIPEADLSNADPKVSFRALGEIEGKLKDYEKLIGRYEEKRAQAIRIATECDAAYDRLVKLEGILAEVNSSPAGAFANAMTGGTYAFLWGDVATSLFDEVSLRAAAARDLVKAYDTTLAQMKRNLENYRVFRDWARFYRLQDAARITRSGNKGADPNFKEADQLLKSAQTDQFRARSIEPSSRAREGIEARTEEARQRAAGVREEVDKLWAEAERKDESAARHQQTLALLGLASGIAAGAQSVGSGSTTNKSPRNANIQYYRHYERKVTPPAPPPRPTPAPPAPVSPGPALVPPQ
jgi:hypothetical protein